MSSPVAGDETEVLIIAGASVAGGVVLLVGFSLLRKQLQAASGGNEQQVEAAPTPQDIVDILVPQFDPQSTDSAGVLSDDEEFQRELLDRQKAIQRDRRRLLYELRSRPGEDPVKHCALPNRPRSPTTDGNNITKAKLIDCLKQTSVPDDLHTDLIKQVRNAFRDFPLVKSPLEDSNYQKSKRLVKDNKAKVTAGTAVVDVATDGLTAFYTLANDPVAGGLQVSAVICLVVSAAFGMIGSIYFIFVAKDSRRQRLIDEQKLTKDISSLVWIWLISATNPETLKLMPWANAARAERLGGMPSVSAALFATLSATLENIPQFTIQILYVRRHAALPDSSPVDWNVQLSIFLSVLSFAVRVLGRYTLACLSSPDTSGTSARSLTNTTSTEATSETEAVNQFVAKLKELDVRRKAADAAGDQTAVDECRAESVALLTSANEARGNYALAEGWIDVLRARAAAANLDEATFDESIAAVQGATAAYNATIRHDGASATGGGTQDQEKQEQDELQRCLSSSEMVALLDALEAAEQKIRTEDNQNDMALHEQSEEQESITRWRDGSMMFLCVTLAVFLILNAVWMSDDSGATCRGALLEETSFFSIVTTQHSDSTYCAQPCRGRVCAETRFIQVHSCTPENCVEASQNISAIRERPDEHACCEGPGRVTTHDQEEHLWCQYEQDCTSGGSMPIDPDVAVMLRLNNPYATHSRQGLLEASTDGKYWGPVCQQQFGHSEVQSACREILTHEEYAGADVSNDGNWSTCGAKAMSRMRTVIENIYCPYPHTGSSLTQDCAYLVTGNAGSSTCPFGDVVWLNCDTVACPENFPARHPPECPPVHFVPQCRASTFSNCTPRRQYLEELASADIDVPTDANSCGGHDASSLESGEYTTLNQSCYSDSDYVTGSDNPHLPAVFTGEDVEEMLWWCCQISVETADRRYDPFERRLGADLSRYGSYNWAEPWRNGHWDYQLFVDRVINDDLFYSDGLARQVRDYFRSEPSLVEQGVFWVPKLGACAIGLRSYWTLTDEARSTGEATTRSILATTITWQLNIAGAGCILVVLFMCCVLCWHGERVQRKKKLFAASACAMLVIIVLTLSIGIASV